MKKRNSILRGLSLVFCLLLLAGCAPQTAKESFFSHGYLKDECVALVNGSRYAFLPKEGSSTRVCYLYELDENGGKKRIVCDKKDCLHEEQGTLADPCHAYSLAAQGLMTDGKSLYAQSKNGSIGIVRFETDGSEPVTLLQQEGQINCFLVQDDMLYWAMQKDGTHYALYRGSLKNPQEDAQEILSEEGNGYFSSIQIHDGKLYLCRMDVDADETALLRTDTSGNSEIVLQGAGPHGIAFLSEGLATSRKDETGAWSLVFLDGKDQTVKEIPMGENPVQVWGISERVYADTGLNLLRPEEERTLYAFRENGEEIGSAAVPENCGYLLGADDTGAFYWQTGEKNELIRVDPA